MHGITDVRDYGKGTGMSEETIKPTRRIVWGKLISGSILGLIVIAGVASDTINNVSYALAAMGLGAAMVAGAVGLLIGLVPVVAYFNGWNVPLRVAAGCCTVTCIVFALLAYGEKNGAHQGEKERAGLSLADAEAARAEARRARDEASSITEAGSVRDLEAIEARAVKALADAEKYAEEQKIICQRSKRCREAAAAANAATERLSKARAKADALARAERAEQRLADAKTEVRQSGVAKANAVASFTGAWAGIEAKDAEQRLAFVIMLVLICTTMSIAFLGEHCIKLMAESVVWDNPSAPKPAARPARAKAALPMPKPQPKSAMDEFLDAWTEISDGPPLQAGEFAKCLAAHWSVKHAGKPVPTSTALGKALGLRYDKIKTGGKQCYMAKLKPMALAKVS
jgi:hypothetical protein